MNYIATQVHAGPMAIPVILKQYCLASAQWSQRIHGGGSEHKSSNCHICHLRLFCSLTIRDMSVLQYQGAQMIGLPQVGNLFCSFTINCSFSLLELCQLHAKSAVKPLRMCFMSSAPWKLCKKSSANLHDIFAAHKQASCMLHCSSLQ